MRKGMAKALVLMACLGLTALALPAPTLAQATPAPAPAASPPPAATPAATPPAGNTIQPPSECDDFVGVTHKIAGCIRLTVEQGAARFFTDFYPFVQRAIGGVITLALIIFGVMLGFGLVEKVGRDTFVLLIKIAAISWLVTSSPMMFRTITDAMDGAAAAVVSYAPPSGPADNAQSDYSQSTCMQAMVQAQANINNATPDGKKNAIITPWLGIDCILDSVIGIKMLPASGNAAALGSGEWFNKTLEDSKADKQGSGMSRAMMFFFFSSMQSSVTGGILALVGFFYVFGLIFLIIRAFFGYIAGYMGIALLVIVSPLFIPMVLFRETKQYFDKWAKMMIGFAMQPIIMLVFIIFSLTAVDLAAFSGNYSVMYQIAGDATRTAPFSLNEYLTKNRSKDGALLADGAPVCEGCGPIIAKNDRALFAIKTTPASGDTNLVTPIAERDLGGLADNLAYSQCTNAKLAEAERTQGADNPLKKICDAQYKVRTNMNNIDWRMLAAARTPPLDNVNPNGTPEEQQAAAKQMAQQVIAAVFFACMVVFVLNGFLGAVPRLVNDLVGDALQSASLNEIFSSSDSGRASSGFASTMSGALGGMASRSTSGLRR